MMLEQTWADVLRLMIAVRSALGWDTKAGQVGRAGQAGLVGRV